MKPHLEIFCSSIVAALSSFTYGLNQTSVTVLLDKVEASYNSHSLKIDYRYFEGVFAFMVFFGGFVSSNLIFLVARICRKNLLLVNNLLYFIGSLQACIFDNAFILLFGRFIIGFAAGISCCTVPSYICSITNESNRGFYMSFHSIGIIIGLVIGKILEVYFTSDRCNTVFLIINTFVLIHTGLLFLIKRGEPLESSFEEQVSLIQLLKTQKARRSIFLAVTFHIAQHASGVDHFSIFITDILNAHPNPDMMSILALVFSAVISILSCTVIDRFGRKVMLILSIGTIIFSTACMGFNIINIGIVLLYMFGFNIGLASIPWLITNEIFPKKFLNSAIRLSTSVNWLAAFIISCVLKILQDKIEHLLFFIYGGFMVVFLIIVVCIFKETKNKPVIFQ